MEKGRSSPEISLFDRQSAFAVDLQLFQSRARSALLPCLSSPGPQSRPLAELPGVEISFVDDSEIARVHDEFMDIPGATDVITFEHGEIIISTETAARYAADFGHALDRELTLYLIHGLLHLNGHEDATADGAERMRLVQENILADIVQD